MASASDAPAPSALDRVDGRLFDVVIIGGGISGASAAQHLSAAGYSVLLAERNDFASGRHGPLQSAAAQRPALSRPAPCGIS
jgi:glycine/D-amino acid oxidase-like deaminating enzyme